MTRDELTLSLLVRDALRNEDVAYAIIADENSKTVAHGDLNLVGKQLERRKGLKPVGNQMLVQSYADAKGGHIIDIAVPMEFSKVPLGALYLGFSDRSIRQTIARARNQTLWITAMMILGGIGGAVGLAIVLTKPIHKLAQGTKAIAAGSFDITLPITARDEIGDLTQSFNDMAKSLREKGDYASALSIIDQFIGQNPRSNEALDLKRAVLLQQGQTLLEQNKLNDSLEAFNQLAKLSPQDSTVTNLAAKVRGRLVRQHYNQGIRFYREEKLAEAISEWRLVLQYEPNHSGAKKNIETAERLLKSLKQRQQKQGVQRG